MRYLTVTSRKDYPLSRCVLQSSISKLLLAPSLSMQLKRISPASSFSHVWASCKASTFLSSLPPLTVLWYQHASWCETLYREKHVLRNLSCSRMAESSWPTPIHRLEKVCQRWLKSRLTVWGDCLYPDYLMVNHYQIWQGYFFDPDQAE